MNDGGSTQPNGEAPGGGSARAPRRGPGNGPRSCAFLGDTWADVTCGACPVILRLGHRAVRFPCG